MLDRLYIVFEHIYSGSKNNIFSNRILLDLLDGKYSSIYLIFNSLGGEILIKNLNNTDNILFYYNIEIKFKEFLFYI